MNLRITVEDRLLRARLSAAQYRLSPGPLRDNVFNRVGMETMAALMLKTPKRFTGHTRKSWYTRPVGFGLTAATEIRNDSPVMFFLEYGTRDHGPVRAKMLFIPLNRRASIEGFRPGMVFGQDFVLARRVRGIRAHHIVRDQLPLTEARAMALTRAYIRRVLGTVN